MDSSTTAPSKASTSHQDVFVLPPHEEPQKLPVTTTLTFANGTQYTIKYTLPPEQTFKMIQGDLLPEGSYNAKGTLKDREGKQIEGDELIGHYICDALKSNGHRIETIIRMYCERYDLESALKLIEKLLDPEKSDQFTQYLKETNQSKDDFLDVFMPEFFKSLLKALNRIWLGEEIEAFSSPYTHFATRARELFGNIYSYRYSSAEALNIAWRKFLPSNKFPEELSTINKLYGITAHFLNQSAERALTTEEILSYAKLASDFMNMLSIIEDPSTAEEPTTILKTLGLYAAKQKNTEALQGLIDLVVSIPVDTQQLYRTPCPSETSHKEYDILTNAAAFLCLLKKDTTKTWDDYEALSIPERCQVMLEFLPEVLDTQSIPLIFRIEDLHIQWGLLAYFEGFLKNHFKDAYTPFTGTALPWSPPKRIGFIPFFDIKTALIDEDLHRNFTPRAFEEACKKIQECFEGRSKDYGISAYFNGRIQAMTPPIPEEAQATT
tara:strand:+ start:36481 stop:37962 length:1482 start_codon:yes stop_codon:yes gene_type:complete